MDLEFWLMTFKYKIFLSYLTAGRYYFFCLIFALITENGSKGSGAQEI